MLRPPTAGGRGPRQRGNTALPSPRPGVTPAPVIKKTRKSAQRIFSRLRDGRAAGGVVFSGRFQSANLNIILGIRRSGTMGAFILGLIVGAGGALVLFIYDEGDIFLKLSRQIKKTAERSEELVNGKK